MTTETLHKYQKTTYLRLTTHQQRAARLESSFRSGLTQAVIQSNTLQQTKISSGGDHILVMFDYFGGSLVAIRLQNLVPHVGISHTSKKKASRTDSHYYCRLGT